MTETPLSFRGRRPTALRFGTSGLRGRVEDITDIEAFINTRGLLDYLFRIGDIRAGDTVCIAGDLRPSTDGPERSIMRAVARAIEDSGLRVENLGKIPTPALTYYGLRTGRASVMVTGSHIPFDRNGIKFNKTTGEILKPDEPGILEAVAEVRRVEYGRPPAESMFDDDGMLRPGARRALPPVNEDGRHAYLQRYVSFFPPRGLERKRVVVFQHSAVGRDMLVETLERLGAEVHALGRSEEFIAIDTENITEDRLQTMQHLVDDVSSRYRPVDALVSTDGDSDRPLFVGVDPEGKARFYGGDLLGIVVAEYLNADGVVVPVSANDAVDLEMTRRAVPVTRTRIGSPWVIEAMEEMIAAGNAKTVVGWEANGGFLTGSLIERDGRSLEPLPTRDAALPLLAALSSMAEKHCSARELFARLPPRFSKAGLLDRFPQDAGRALLRHLSPRDERIRQVDFEAEAVTVWFETGESRPASNTETKEQRGVRRELARYFTPSSGFDDIVRINVIDGVRITFANGDIAHIRPSGNAPQLRLYAVADTEERADEIVRMGVREPDGILRRLEAAYG